MKLFRSGMMLFVVMFAFQVKADGKQCVEWFNNSAVESLVVNSLPSEKSVAESYRVLNRQDSLGINNLLLEFIESATNGAQDQSSVDSQRDLEGLESQIVEIVVDQSGKRYAQALNESPAIRKLFNSIELCSLGRNCNFGNLFQNTQNGDDREFQSGIIQLSEELRAFVSKVDILGDSFNSLSAAKTILNSFQDQYPELENAIETLSRLQSEIVILNQNYVGSAYELVTFSTMVIGEFLRMTTDAAGVTDLEVRRRWVARSMQQTSIDLRRSRPNLFTLVNGIERSTIGQILEIFRRIRQRVLGTSDN